MVRRSVAMVVSCVAFAAVAVPSASAQTAAPSGGTQAAPPPAPLTPPATAPTEGPVVPGAKAKLIKGVAHAPADAPQPVKQAIWAGNQLQAMPYRYGGGHAKLVDTGYDCSGTVSYALANAGLLETPLDSSSFMAWGEGGPGQWITVYTNPSHAYVVIAGLRLDTSAANDRGGAKGPRWRKRVRGGSGFTARHLFGH